jgi:hypothetical protein
MIQDNERPIASDSCRRCRRSRGNMSAWGPGA